MLPCSRVVFAMLRSVKNYHSDLALELCAFDLCVEFNEISDIRAKTFNCDNGIDGCHSNCCPEGVAVGKTCDADASGEKNTFSNPLAV